MSQVVLGPCHSQSCPISQSHREKHQSKLLPAEGRRAPGVCSSIIRPFLRIGNLLGSVFIHLSSFQLCFSDWELFCLFSPCTRGASTASREVTRSFLCPCCGNRGFNHTALVTWTGELRFLSINVVKLRRSGDSKKVGKASAHDLLKIKVKDGMNLAGIQNK